MCPVSMRAVFMVAPFLLCASTSFAFYGLSKVSPSGDFLDHILEGRERILHPLGVWKQA